MLSGIVAATPLGLTAGAQTPEHNFGLIHGEAPIVRRLEAGRLTDRAVDVVGTAARATHHVVVVVTDASLISGRVSGGLYPPE